MSTFGRDLRFALRSLRAQPAFAAVAIATIAIGIGANTAIFSVVDGVLLRELPFDKPSELVRVWSSNAERGVERGFMSPPDIADYQEQNRTFTAMAAYSEAELAMIDRDGSAVKITGTWAGDNLFSVLGVTPFLGRTFNPDDGAPGAPKVMVLGYGFWQSRHGGDPDVIGTSITVEEASYTVVGVMRRGFDFPGNSNFWLNRYLLSYPGRYARWMDVVGRLDEGVGIEAARADLEGIAQRLEAEYPNWNRAYRTTMISLHDAVVGDVRTTLYILFGATGFLLLIACVNVVNLLLSRMVDRGRELAVRAALGAGRLRLTRQLLTESLVMALGGAVAGTALAAFGVDALIALGPADLPRLDDVHMSNSVLLFTLGTTVLVGLGVGLAPALWLSRIDIQAVLQDASKGSTSGGLRERMRRALVPAEIALAVMLAIGAVLLTRSFSRLQNTDPGFNSTGVLTFQLDLPTGSYREMPTVADYYARMTERLNQLSGVESVAATATLPFDREVPFLGNFAIVNRPVPKQGEEPRAHYRQITPGYLRTMGIGLISGRGLETGDDRNAPGAVLINEALAARYFPGEDPVNKVLTGFPPHLALGGFLADSFQIAGVVQDVKYFGLANASEPSLYFSVYQAPFRRMHYTLRTGTAPAALMPLVRREVGAVDPSVPVSRVEVMERIVSNSVARERFSMLLLTIFAGCALLLAAVGIYGVISYSVSQRTAELGIRMAVGADAGEVLRLVMGQAARLAGWGVTVGIAGALVLSRVMANQLYGISSLDPTTFVGVALGLVAVALLAALIPALRAARIDPVVALQGAETSQ